eukprot:3411854-Pleurochrysis_carterae.AAC.4
MPCSHQSHVQHIHTRAQKELLPSKARDHRPPRTRAHSALAGSTQRTRAIASWRRPVALSLSPHCMPDRAACPSQAETAANAARAAKAVEELQVQRDSRRRRTRAAHVGTGVSRLRWVAASVRERAHVRLPAAVDACALVRAL